MKLRALAISAVYIVTLFVSAFQRPSPLSTAPRQSITARTDCGIISRSYLPNVMFNHVDSFQGPLEVEPNDSYQQANGPLRSGAGYQGYPNDQRDFFSIYLQVNGPISINLMNHAGKG